MSATTRIAKNTLALYFRQIIVMLVGLYTMRVVLRTLGTESYGIYGVVAGTITIFEFLSNAMATAIRRWLSLALGQPDIESAKQVFGISFAVCFIIMVLIVCLAETIGLWFVNNKLAMPENRRLAAQWAYQFAIGVFMCVIAVIPCNALIIAHEDMNILAYISIAEALLKLAIVFILQIISIDKLPLYGFLLFISGIISLVMYIVICKYKYREYRFRPYWDKDLFKRIAAYTGWNCLSMSAVSCRNQGTAILLNQFFGAAIVSARNIAFSVNSALASVMFNFTMALRPQIIKNYATNNREKMLSLTFLCSKISYYLMYIVSLPFILEMPFILSVWLQNFPEYTVMFTRLISIELLMVCLTTGQAELVKASEQIKIREIIYAVVFMFNLPLSWFFLNFVNALPYSVSCIMIFLTIIEFILQLFIARRLINFPILAFLKAVIMPILIITLLSLIVPVMLIILLNQSFLRLCLVFAASIVSSCICIFLFGFDKMEKNGIKRIVMNKIRLWKK